jgi:GT2 family glycosyltransferase/SAM-dependent methyltransferase
MLEWTGERYVPWFEGAEIGYEHLHRYAFATQFVRNKNVLDLACGEGYGSNLLARTAKHVVGIDLDEPTVKHAKNKYIRSNLEFRIGSITEIPINGQGAFDVIVCFEALEHVADHEKLLSEAKRLLAPGGLFFISTPNKTLYTDEPHFNNPYHVHELYFDEFKTELEHYFKQVKVLGQRIYCNSNIWPLFPEKRTLPSEFVIERNPQEFTFVQPEKRAPIYFIAVATNSAKDIGGHLSVLVDISNQLVSERDHAINRLSAERDDFKNRTEHLQPQVHALQQLVAHNKAELAKRNAQIAGLSDDLKKTKDRYAQDVKWLQQVITDHERKVAFWEREASELRANLTQQLAILEGIHSSHAWKALSSYYVWRDRLLPENTFRRDFVTALFKLLLTFRSILRPRQRVPQTPAAVAEAGPPAPAAAVQDVQEVQPGPVVYSAESHQASTEDENKHYEALSDRISAIRSSRIENLELNTPSLLSIAETDFAATAQSLVFPSGNDSLVSIVIPVFNNLKFTLECLKSVMMYSYGMQYEVIVVDDASTDKTEEVLRHAPNLIYIRNEKNLGFVHACNRGAESAKGKFLLFLNNDTQVTENWLQPLIDTFSEYENVGAVGPKILFPDGRLQEAGTLVNRDGTSRLIGVFDNPNLPRYNYVREVMYCSGACLMVETSKFKELGGFEVSLAPGYCEDWDLAFLLREQGLHVLYNPGSTIVHHLSVTSNTIDRDFKIGAVVRNQQKLAQKWQRQIDALNNTRLIAFYLPQYHPIPENDRWWGKGFTDWSNVAKARPNYIGHYQPHLPGELGFYDLRVDQVADQQAELAKRYGLHGFCYFYYWFAGKRLLDLPLERHLKSNKPNIPFCLVWANENWTRRWDGLENEVLVGQQHSDEDDRAVILDMMRYFRHPNYIRVNGRPMLLVYRISLFPDIIRTTEIWRDQCLREGIGDIYLVQVESFEKAAAPADPAQFGFDASVEFPPHGMAVPINGQSKLNPDYDGLVSDYRETALKYLELEIPNHVRFRSVMPSWDNTPRRQHQATVYDHATPGAYQAWLESILVQTHEQNFGEERIVFVNAWNEWAEGNHLEPDKRYGHGFLEATRNALDASLLRRS